MARPSAVVAGLIILANDIVWWVPFLLVLQAIRRESMSRQPPVTATANCLHS